MIFKKDSYYWMLILSGFVLFLAYFLEIVLDVIPCSLCLYQRLLYFILFLISICALLFPGKKKYFFIPVVLTLLSEALIAVYHVGIEHYLIEDDFVCYDNTLEYLSFQKITTSCSNIRFKFMNFSLAEWNLIFASIVMYFFIRFRKIK